MVYRADLRAAALAAPGGGGGNPLLLNAYGAYGGEHRCVFNPARLSLIDRGVIFAIAHVRGGGDLGSTWYEEAMGCGGRRTRETTAPTRALTPRV